MIRVAAMLALGAAIATGQPLPEWDAADRAAAIKDGWMAGAALLADELPPEAELVPLEPLEFENLTAEEIVGDAEQPNWVPEKFLDEYFAARPGSFLIDPQGLLAATDQRERLAFLDYHASDSAVDLFVYVFGGDQDVPSEVRKEEVIERFFAEGRPAAIVYYYLGAPERSQVYLSPSITGKIPSAERHRAMESSVMQAFEKADPAVQLERFLVQMSIRIYWMERLMTGEPALLESAIFPPAQPRDKSGDTEKFAWVEDLATQAAVPAGSLAVLALLGWALRRWLRDRARYQFPEFDVEPRLGGAHAAGIGAVISFASASVTPASQRDQVPDYLRRAR